MRSSRESTRLLPLLAMTAAAIGLHALVFGASEGGPMPAPAPHPAGYALVVAAAGGAPISAPALGAPQNPTECECYQAGVAGHSRPDGCRDHFMGPMTPYLGGYYDRQRGNQDYLNDNDWCRPARPGTGGGDNSCRYAYDGECDEGSYCNAGTDTADCGGGGGAAGGGSGSGPGGGGSGIGGSLPGEFYAARGRYPDWRGCAASEQPFEGICWSCHAGDGHTLAVDSRMGTVCWRCPAGTTLVDLEPMGGRVICEPASADLLPLMMGDDSCRYANDGECDEPRYCAVGTDTTDCGGVKATPPTPASGDAGAAPPSAAAGPVLLGPAGEIDGPNVTFRWRRDPASTTFVLEVLDANADTVLRRRIKASAICTASDCVVDDPTALAPGDYLFRVFAEGGSVKVLPSTSPMAFTIR